MENPEFASASRAYLRYYFGDDPAVSPPIEGDNLGESIERAIGAVFSRFSSVDYKRDVLASRQLVDVLTILDLVNSRELSLDEGRLGQAEGLLTSLSSEETRAAYQIGSALVAAVRARRTE